MNSTLAARLRLELLDGVVEPLAREHKAHVGQLAGGPHERQLALLHERGPVDRSDREGRPLLGRSVLAEGIGNAEVEDLDATGGDRRVALDLAQRVVRVGDQAPGPAKDPAARVHPQAAALVAEPDVGHVGGVESADDQHRRLSQQPGERDREEAVPVGKPREHEIGAQHAADHRDRVGQAARLVEVLQLEALGQDLAVDGYEAGLARVDVEDALAAHRQARAPTGSRASTNAWCHSESSSRQ